MTLPNSVLATEAATVDIVIQQGSTYYQAYTLEDAGSAVDLTGCTATAKLKDVFSGSTLATFTCAIPTPANGTITVTLPVATTAALTGTFPTTSTRKVAIGVWDLEVIDGSSQVARLAQGTTSLSREVTV
jgi:hypothetical protein